jgi:Ala-tRNA(Pro) deacylase
MKTGKESFEMILEHGSPADMSCRSDREKRAYALLDRLGVSFDRTDHRDRPATSMEACAEIDAVLNVRICKNLFLCNRQKTDFYLLVMPGDKPFKTKELSGQLGVSRLSFADGEAMERLLDLKPGSVSVLGLMNDAEKRVRLLVDEDVLKEEMFACHPCENTSSIRFATKDLTDVILPALGVRPTTVKLVGTE